MGQAKQRGTFEQRRAAAIARKAERLAEYRKAIGDPHAELPKLPEEPSFTLVAALSALGLRRRGFFRWW